MFDALPASRRLDRIRPESALLAASVHGAIVTIAILATRAVPGMIQPAREQAILLPAPAHAAGHTQGADRPGGSPAEGASANATAGRARGTNGAAGWAESIGPGA